MLSIWGSTYYILHITMLISFEYTGLLTFKKVESMNIGTKLPIKLKTLKRLQTSGRLNMRFLF